MSNPAATAAEPSQVARRHLEWTRIVRVAALVLAFALVAMMAAKSLAIARAVDEPPEDQRPRAPDAPRMPPAAPPAPRTVSEPLPPLPPVPGPLPRQPAVSTADVPATPTLVRR